MDQPNYIVFQCYGNERVFQECTYALLSFSRFYGSGELKNTEIWIYTDNPEWFRSFKDCPLPLKYREVNSNLIRQWRGSIDFVHRVKIEVLKDITADKKGNFLYLDTDIVVTYCLDKMLTDINAGSLYMHIMEGKVSEKGNSIFRKLNNYLIDAKEQLNGKPMNNMVMWNAGVLGFNTDNLHLLNDVLCFTDQVYPKFPKHVVEQFAFSVFFQDAGNIKAAAPYVFHYWNLKEAGQVLASFFSYFNDCYWEELVRCSTLIRLNNMMQEKVVFLGNRGIGGILAGKKWIPATPDWSELVKQL